MGERKGTKGLELWCRKMTEGYPGVKIDNMTTSWRDGLAFCAIIHHFRPDLIDFEKLNKDDIYHNNELAYRVAEHHLGIPALLEAEDMVEYEVPDRLSILTYLSQFYQFFENPRGKSGARIAPKRPQTTPDHGIVSPASTSPPTKVQITIGRAKREPCAKCGLPVFIAERLNVGKLLYHRTCFRCARCNSQLTLANYYETENAEFCCEICPDEEKLISKKISSEHSVLMRSMSDEEKSASLQTYSEAPDAYSTHFEVALEYPIDRELQKNFTLTSAESTARSHFFKSQIEDSSDSSSEDIPPDLPASKPPPIDNNISSNIKTNSELVFRDISFPSDIKDTNEGSDSVSEQTNNHFVTKDNTSSTSGVSVRARMKLFENNKDKKSDVNSFSSSKQVPFDSTPKKKATVVAIEDLEDFDNISRKDIKIDDITLDNTTNNKVYSDEVKHECAEKPIVLEKKTDPPKDSKIDFSKNNTFTSNTQMTINSNNIDDETKKQARTSPRAKYEVDATLNQKTQHDISEISPVSTKRQDSMIAFRHSQEQGTGAISVESDKEKSKEIVESEKSHISIEDSPVENKEISVITISDDSVLSAAKLSPQTISSNDSTVPKRGYYTAYEVVTPSDNVLSPLTSPSNDSPVPKRGYHTAYEVAPPSDNDLSPQPSLTNDSTVPKRGYYTAYEVAPPSDSVLSPQTSPSNDSPVPKRGYHTAYEVAPPSENDSLLDNSDTHNIISPEKKYADAEILFSAENELENTDISLPLDDEVVKESAVNEIENSKKAHLPYNHSKPSGNETQQVKSLEEIIPTSEDRFTEEIISPSKDLDSERATSELAENKLTIVNTDTSLTKQELLSEENKVIVSSNELENDLSKGDETETPPPKPSQTESPKDKEHWKSSNKSQSDYPESLNPFDDESEDESSAVSTSLNPFGEPDEEEVIVAPKPVPAARPKKKIIPSLEERQFTGTPEALSRIYIQRISLNPFADDDNDDEKVEEPVLRKPVPSPRQRKKISLPMNMDQFESEEDEDMIVPVPAPRIPKTSPARPEPKIRDTLSITSRGSHGGSNSSISSGSAVGSARKKKPAPRPPVPFRHSELPSGPTSLTVSPNPSAAQSPNLSGTIRSRKSKRAPLPPKASTPNTDRKDVCETLAIDISPLSEEGSAKASEEHAQAKKNAKDEENRNRQSHNITENPPSNEIDSNITTLNKSQSGRWKRRKGQAPSIPIPQRRMIKSLPMSEIKRELDTIEIQQQGLEKQGVRLEQIIREKCEGEEGNHADDSLPIEVEDLILQLFELVNEKNELFRRQAELMYLRRQQRLEEEHADVEYQIRCIINEPDANKTDSDKAREEALINRLVEIVERRNEIIECLEMDRVREAEEDNSISSQLNLYSLKRDGEKEQPTEQGKKDKKKKHKKISKIIHTLKHKEKEKEKGHKVDIDKDVDETEVSPSTDKKKKKKFNIF